MIRNKLFLILALHIFSTTAYAKDGDPDVSPKIRMAAASEKLKGKSGEIAIYVKGLVCSSCAIGVKIHLRKLDFVDKSKLDKGLVLDIDSQLATVAVKPGGKITNKEIVEALDNAGYEGETIFRWNGKKVSSNPLK